MYPQEGREIDNFTKKDT